MALFNGLKKAPKKYVVHSVFPTVQGEGLNTGRAAIFVRFSACNVWDGREENRQRDAERNAGCALFCDTVFLGVDEAQNGGSYTAEELVALVSKLWNEVPGGIIDSPFVVLTGGEPGLQIDADLVAKFQAVDSYVAVETNGSVTLPDNLDWVTCSPKPPMPLVLKRASELKILWPLCKAEDYEDFESDERWIQVVDDPDSVANTVSAVIYVTQNPQWRLSVQAHKVWQVP